MPSQYYGLVARNASTGQEFLKNASTLLFFHWIFFTFAGELLALVLTFKI